jgi:CubicO group peptidase (beta-lactamase class C family)
MCASTRKTMSFRPGILRHCVWIVMSAGFALTLSACGGGGGGGGDGGGQQQTNVAPTVQAGADQTVTLPANSVQLQGSATDDGLPSGASLAYAWTVTQGSGVTLGSASSASTSAAFAAAGTYVLTLTVSDSALSGSDTVQVTVNPAANVAPVAQAGTDQTIELPVDTAQLQGSATDDGAASSLTYSWAVNSGPGTVTFGSANAAATSAKFSAAGAYVLRLTVSDGSLSATDDVAVTVNPAVYPAADTDENVPDRGWTRVAAADVGMNATLLEQAATYAQTGGVGASFGGAGMIVRRGRLVHSWGDIDARFDVKSATKSIGGIALGLAIDDARVALTDLAQARLPSIGNPPPENANTGWLDDITVLHLGTHTAGFDKPGDFQELLFQPGTTWSYSDSGLNWLADLLTEVYAQDLNTVVSSRVWSTIGISAANPATADDLRWRPNQLRPGPHPSGIEHRELASGILVNSNAMARVGLLFLRNGVWSSGRVISQAFVDTVRVPAPSIASVANPDAANFPNAPTNYGVLWWTNATGMLANVPRDAYWAWGLGDNLIVVIPSLDVVAVRVGPQNTTVSAGRTWNDSDWNGDYAVLAPFIDPIVQSVTP